jgi:hypothetical protein
VKEDSDYYKIVIKEKKDRQHKRKEGQTTQKKRTDNTKEKKDRQHKRKEGQTTQKKRRTDNTKEKKDKKTNNVLQNICSYCPITCPCVFISILSTTIFA